MVILEYFLNANGFYELPFHNGDLASNVLYIKADKIIAIRHKTMTLEQCETICPDAFVGLSNFSRETSINESVMLFDILTDGRTFSFSMNHYYYTAYSNVGDCINDLLEYRLTEQ
ncbi:hypothetical protein LS71_008350 [Helicobacter jaachi]|uniref:Uncharacterized protein n=1 Tax=Helicobacter jaachi TaxID=1677920 RepID=A0A4U8T7B9_9HELI|nr:hypothetical protein [Helicobacter jaachi]TLD95408.1 hypothetical protein LS71_008350 [Helicobacter jaachi]